MKKIIYNNFWVLIILAPYIYTLSASNYMPSSDETYQLDAAKNISNGLGYVCLFEPNNNLSSIEYNYLDTWPPGYSYMISLIIFLGIPILSAAKMLKIFFLIFSIFSWNILSTIYLKGKKINLIYLGIIAIATIFYSSSPTDLILFSIFPILVFLLLKYFSDFPSKSKYFNSERILVLLMSIIIGFLITIRYHSLFLIGVVITIIFLKNNFKIIKSVKLILLFSIIPFLTFFIISILNKVYSGDISEHTSTGIQSVSFNYKWVYEIINNLTVNQLFFNKILIKLHYYGVFIIPVTILSAILLFYVLNKGYKNEKIKEFVFIYIILTTFDIFFLLLLTVFFFNAKDQWVPVTEFRYYWFLFPLFLLLVFSILENRFIDIHKNIKNFLFVITFLSLLISSSFYSRYRYLKYETFEKEKTIIESKFDKVRKEHKDKSVLVYATNPYLSFFLLDYNLPVYRDFTKLFNPNTYFTKNTLVFLIEKKNRKQLISIENNIKLHNSRNELHGLAKSSLVSSSSDSSFSFIWYEAKKGPSIISCFDKR